MLFIGGVATSQMLQLSTDTRNWNVLSRSAYSTHLLRSEHLHLFILSICFSLPQETSLLAAHPDLNVSLYHAPLPVRLLHHHDSTRPISWRTRGRSRSVWGHRRCPPLHHALIDVLDGR